ncbi:protein-glutamate methylesterase/protein-glutamine glutaminase [Paenibacillus tuaregi]|uniref:protein-glutamate methylesterase/protein-glutamine glutaminase n=1 Tax=Paenibacillus tuaregi TaxID=1816681 RepID=UPI00083974C8|nr:chemotaxis response regulator protein-glutamate methylesterase [Paenibacillus tuaregi]
MRPYRILVVDDSAFMRKIISDLIEQDPDLKVVGTARNGQEALKRIAELEPDLVTMDVEMPEMNGLEALRQIMSAKPIPVIMLSGINEEGMRETIMALELGAFDFIRKPSITTSSQGVGEVGQALREQIRTAMQAEERRQARKEAEASALKQLSSPVKPSVQPPESRQRIELSSSEAGSQPVPDGLKTDSLKELKENPPWPPVAGTSKPADSQASAAKPPAVPKPEPGKPAPNPSALSPKPRSNKDKQEPALPKSRLPSVGSGTAAQDPAAVQNGKSSDLQPDAAKLDNRPSKTQKRTSSYSDIVAIGSSTGGPKALKTVLEMIPADFPAPIIIVQHMPPNFTHSLAQRLNSLSPLQVVEAKDGMELQKGWAYIAPGGYHMTVKAGQGNGYKIVLNKDELRNGHRPSADVMYESLLPLEALKRHIVLLTGMGSDGARVMKQLYDAGVTSTFAESEETCVVYGMPRSAVELKCVSYVLPLYEIAPKLVQVVK